MAKVVEFCQICYISYVVILLTAWIILLAANFFEANFLSRVLESEITNMADINDKIDLIRVLHFIWKNKRIYIISMITCISLTFIYCIYIIPDTYESTAVLYYPERAGGEIESVSERDLMDDAVEILRQKRMLAIVEDKTGVDWE